MGALAHNARSIGGVAILLLRLDIQKCQGAPFLRVHMQAMLKQISSMRDDVYAILCRVVKHQSRHIYSARNQAFFATTLSMSGNGD